MFTQSFEKQKSDSPSFAFFFINDWEEQDAHYQLHPQTLSTSTVV